MPSSFLWQFLIIVVTILSFTTSTDLSLGVNKLDTLLLDDDGAESTKIDDSGMANHWGEILEMGSEVLLTNSGKCSTGPNQKSPKRRRNDAWCKVEQVEQKKPIVQQQVNQGPDKSGSPPIEENIDWAPKWDIRKYGTPADLYCVEDDSQRVLVCAQNMDWRDMKMPDGTPVTFPTTIEWCTPCKFALTVITQVQKSRGNSRLRVNMALDFVNKFNLQITTCTLVIPRVVFGVVEI